MIGLICSTICVTESFRIHKYQLLGMKAIVASCHPTTHASLTAATHAIIHLLD
jgi:hypothetical protein